MRRTRTQPTEAMTNIFKNLAMSVCCAPLCLLGAGCASGPERAADAQPALATEAAIPQPSSSDKVAAKQPLDALGVELVGVSLSAADFLIDLRYRVKDTTRAQALLDRKVHPVLVNESTGDRYYVPSAPKVGTLRQTAGGKQVVQMDRVYFMLFANPDRKLKAGEKVTLYAGDSIVRDIVVKH